MLAELPQRHPARPLFENQERHVVQSDIAMAIILAQAKLVCILRNFLRRPTKIELYVWHDTPLKQYNSCRVTQGRETAKSEQNNLVLKIFHVVLP